MHRIAGCLQEEQAIPRSLLANMLGYSIDKLQFYEDHFLHLSSTASKSLQVYHHLLIAFEGSIYNENEIISEAQKLQTTHNIYEAIAILYTAQKQAFIQKIEGKFNLYLYDIKLGQFLIFRDRLGYYPLYWTRSHKGLLFSSDLKTLLASGVVFQKLNFEALSFYLYFGFIPQEKTPLDNVYKLLPGHFLRYTKDHDLEITPYFSLAKALKGKTLSPSSFHSKNKTCTAKLSASTKDIADLVWKLSEPLGALYPLELYLACKQNSLEEVFPTSSFLEQRIKDPGHFLKNPLRANANHWKAFFAKSLKWLDQRRSFDFLRSMYTHPYHQQFLENSFFMTSNEIEGLDSPIFKKLNTELFLHRFPALHELGSSRLSLVYLFLKNEMPSLYLHSRSRIAQSFMVNSLHHHEDPLAILNNLDSLFCRAGKNRSAFETSEIDDKTTSEFFHFLLGGELANSGILKQSFLLSLKKGPGYSRSAKKKIYLFTVFELWLEQFIEKSPREIAKKIYEENNFS